MEIVVLADGGFFANPGVCREDLFDFARIVVSKQFELGVVERPAGGSLAVVL
jgi:hypothetical protein